MALGMPREEMLRRMTSRELTEWWIFAQLEPFGSEVEFMRGGIIAATVANSSRGKKGKAAKVEDFMPKFERQKEPDTDSLLKFVEQLNAQMGGQDLRGG